MSPLPIDPWGEERTAAQARVDAERVELTAANTEHDETLTELDVAQASLSHATTLADDATNAERLAAAAVNDEQDDLAYALSELDAIPPIPEVPDMAWPQGQTTKQALGAYVNGGDFEGAQQQLSCTFRYQLRYTSRATESLVRSTLVKFAEQGNEQRANVLSFAIAVAEHGATNKERLRATANGAMDDTFQAFGSALRAKAKVKGWTMADGRPRWIGRAAWECTGDWYKEFMLAGATAEFKAAYRRMTQQVNCPQVPWVYCLANGSGRWDDVLAAYPGDDVVSGLELDTYDAWEGYPTSTNAQVWDRKVNGWKGANVAKVTLQRGADFALAHGLFLAIGEHGVWDQKVSGTQRGGLDNPQWYGNVYRWLEMQRQRGIPIGYVNVFLQDFPPNGPFHDLRTTRFPRAAADFRAHY